jgi:hypothetical protein
VLDRLAAWGGLLLETVTSDSFSLTIDKVMGLKDVTDRILSAKLISGIDITKVETPKTP